MIPAQIRINTGKLRPEEVYKTVVEELKVYNYPSL